MTSASTGSKSAGNRGPSTYLELASQIVVLLAREVALDRALQELSVLDSQALRLGACVEQAVGPAVRVTEGLCDPLEPYGERTQHRRARRLDTGERAVLSRAERERDEDERSQHEHAHDETAAKRTSAA